MGSLWLWAGYEVLRIGAVFVGRERALGFGFMANVVAHAFLWIYLLDAGVAFSLRVLFLGLGLCKNAVPVGRRVIAYEITNHHAFVRTSRRRDPVTYLAGECSRTEISLEVLCLHKWESAITWDLTSSGLLGRIGCHRSESHYSSCTHDKLGDLESLALQEHMCIQSSGFTGLHLVILVWPLGMDAVVLTPSTTTPPKKKILIQSPRRKN